MRNRFEYIFIVLALVGIQFVVSHSLTPAPPTTISAPKTTSRPTICDYTLSDCETDPLGVRSLLEDLKENPSTAVPGTREEQKRQYLAMQGKMLASIATELSIFYAEMTDRFTEFLVITEDFMLDPSDPEFEPLNSDLLTVKLTLMRTLNTALQNFIRDVSEISLVAVTHVQHEEIEKSVTLLLANTRTIFQTIINTSEHVLTGVRDSPVMEEPIQTRVASSILTITNNKLSNFSNLLQQIVNALKNKQDRNRIQSIVQGIDRLSAIDYRIRNEMLLAALNVELEAINSSSLGQDVNLDAVIDPMDDDLTNWMTDLGISDS